MRYSAIVTCLTECVVAVEADSEAEAAEKMANGQIVHLSLHDGGLPLNERVHDVEIVEESFGADGAQQRVATPLSDEERKELIDGIYANADGFGGQAALLHAILEDLPDERLIEI